MENVENDFDSIRPYSEEEALEAILRISRHPALPTISKYLFPRQPAGTLAKMLRNVNSIDEFQDTIMMGAVSAILAKTSEGFTYSGIENLLDLKEKKFIALSNHRDIVLDPSLIQYLMKDNGLPYSEICVGNNLLSSQLIEDLMRSNRMIKVIRGISARALYLCSQNLSAYIRNSVTTGSSAVWIAQREGRTKDGLDTTEQGLLKMFDMSGKGSFAENFEELNILPFSISYEYESCDIKKAREILIKRTTGTYVKKKKEDLHSILTGIRQQKGHIHITVGKALTRDEIAAAAELNGNDKYQSIRHTLDRRIIEGYKLFKTNFMAYDMMNGTNRFLGVKYLPEDVALFEKYITHKINKTELRLDRAALRDIFLHIYGNPVVSKESIGCSLD